MTFNERLINSRPKTALVAAYFISNGYDVYCRAPHIPKGKHDLEPDKGDLLYKERENNWWWLVEVKGHEKEKYTSDQLLTYRLVIIDRKSIFDAKPKRPNWYYIVGTDVENALVFDMNDWGKVTIGMWPDQGSGNLEPCYAAPPDCFKKIHIGV